MRAVEYILTAREMQQYDKNTIEHFKVPALVLMEQAALLAMEEIRVCLGREKKRILILSGTGNNGGDAMALARLLYLNGYDITVFIVSHCIPEEIKFSREAAVQYEIIKNMKIPIVTMLPSDSYDMIIDGIFGVGLNREIEGNIRYVIDAVNHYQAIRLSLDIPSGIDATGGNIYGICFKADITITFAFFKRGLFLKPGSQFAGRVVKKEMGITPMSFLGELPGMEALCGNVSDYLPARDPEGHKGTFGKILVVGGSKEVAGAAYLAGKAAFYSGCGMVRICIHRAQYEHLFPLLPEAIYDCYGREEEVEEAVKRGLEWADAVILGPGMGQDTMAETLWKLVIEGKKIPLVIDADGLTILSRQENTKRLRKLQQNADSRRVLVLTPHLLEFSRITGKEKREIESKWEELLLEYTDSMKAILVKKDARTVICNAQGRMTMNLSGNHGMATAGSGDVLSGIIGAFLAVFENPYEAVQTAVYFHGRAGDIMAEEKGYHGLMAGELLTGMSLILKNHK